MIYECLIKPASNHIAPLIENQNSWDPFIRHASPDTSNFSLMDWLLVKYLKSSELQ